MHFTDTHGHAFGNTPMLHFPRQADGNNEYLKYEKFMTFKIRKASKWDYDKNPKIFTAWYFRIFAEGRAIYTLHSSKDFSIEDYEVPANDEQLKNLIIYTHQLLREVFNDEKKAFPEYEIIKDLSDEEIHETLSALKEVLQTKP